MTTRRAIVDVDGTLWNLWAYVRSMLHEKYGIKLKAEAPTWNYHREAGVTDEQFYDAVRAAHAMQIFCEPFAGATLLFDALDRKGYEVIVASHREKQTAQRLAKWLRRYGLEPYSGLYTGYNKYFLFGAKDLVIDDNPETIRIAQAAGCQVLSLEWEYNKEALTASIGTGGPPPVAFPTYHHQWADHRKGKYNRAGLFQGHEVRGLEDIARWVLEQ